MMRLVFDSVPRMRIVKGVRTTCCGKSSNFGPYTIILPTDTSKDPYCVYGFLASTDQQTRYSPRSIIFTFG
jgi:hypothetical protein